MRDKLLTVGVLAMALVFAGNAYAANQGGNSGAAEPAVQQTQVEQQTQATNQGEAEQVQAQNEEQVQSGTSVGAGDQVQEQDRERLQDSSGAGSQGSTGNVQTQTGSSAGDRIQQQEQQRLPDNSGDGNQVQNQVNNQGEDSQVKAKEKTKSANNNKGGSATAQERRSQVANAVQVMLQVADRNGGIGEQVRVIAQAQNQNQEKLETSLETVQNRGALAKFFLGPNYSEIKKAEKLLVQNREQIQELNQIKNQLINQGDDRVIMEQIQALEQANLEIENSLGTAQKGFSLFGWLNKMLSK